MKSFGGDFSLKIFDTFTGAVSGVIDAAIIAALALSTQGMGGGGGPDGGRPRVGGKGAGRVDPRVARKYAERFGRDAALKKFGKEGVGKLGGKYARSGATNLARKGLVGLAGKGGAKAVLGFAKPFLKRLPIIGALIDFGLSVALGEDPGRAAFKAIGAGLLGFVGAAIGTVVPVAGNLVGGIIGGIAGDALGGALYDMFFGGKKPKAQKSQTVKAAGGGPAPVTRGNKIVGGAVKRTISRKPVKRGVKVQVTKVKPGGSIGGKKKIEKIFPEVPTKDKGKNVNPLGYMQSSYNIATKTPSFGALFALPLKAQLGEKPSSVDYMKAAEELSGWMQNTFRGTAGYAGGGKVEAGMFGGDDTTNVIAKSLEENISSKVDAAIKELQKQLMLKEGEKETGQKKTGPDGEDGEFEVGAAGNSGDALTMARNLMRDLGLTAEQAAGIVGNMIAESGVENARPQNTPPGTKGVLKVDDVTGYGIVQWTSRGRQQALADYAKSKGADLSKPLSMDIEYQFFLKELKSDYASVLSQIKQAKDVKTASTIFMQQYEVPAGYKTEAKIMERYNKSKPIYDKLAKGEGKATEGPGTYIDNPLSGKLGAGYGSGGSKIAGDLGDYMKQVKIPTGEIHQHPRHPGWSKRSYKSYHNEGRAIDLGGYGPAHPSSGGKDEQAPIIKAMIEWNKKNNVTPVDLRHGSPAFSRFGIYESSPNALHSHHVHVAYAKGGRVNRPTFALIGEKGKEFIFDADTTKGLDFLAPNLLEYLNAAKTKTQLMSVLQSYAGYEDGAEQTVIVMNNSQMVPIPIPTGNSGSIGGMSRSSSIDTTYDTQYANA